MNDSWWLKVKRAQKHMVDIRRGAGNYARLHPYEFTRVRQPDRKRDVRYSVQITQQPDPMLAVMLGDFIHNLRSALDHIIVAASLPKYRKNAAFPIAFEDLWELDANGQFVAKHAEARQKFQTAVNGLDPRATSLGVAVAAPLAAIFVGAFSIGLATGIGGGSDLQCGNITYLPASGITSYPTQAAPIAIVTAAPVAANFTESDVLRLTQTQVTPLPPPQGAPWIRCSAATYRPGNHIWAVTCDYFANKDDATRTPLAPVTTRTYSFDDVSGKVTQ